MKRISTLHGVVLALVVFTSSSHAAGLASSNYVINPAHVNGGGGCSASEGGVYALTASIADKSGVGAPSSENYGLSDGLMPSATGDISLLGSTPADLGSLWRSRNNIVRLTFDSDIVLPGAGELLVQEMLDAGEYGADLSSGFAFAVENDGDGDPCVLRIEEQGSVFSHRKWYALCKDAGWLDVEDFILQFVVQVGDASGDGQVMNQDIGLINDVIPTFNAPDDDRRDIDGDGRILNRDVGLANQYVPSFEVPIPSGH